MGRVEPGACVCVRGGRPRLRVLLFVTASLWNVLACACVRASEPVRASVCWGPGVA